MGELDGKGELDGRVAIVTGGARGIGRAIVERFVEAGAQVVIADIATDDGEALAAELGEAAAFSRTDVSVADDVQAAVDLAVARFGGLHVMVNNAGTSGDFTSFLADDFSGFDHEMGVNLRGVLLGAQRAARHMKDHGGGVILTTTSIGGINAGAGLVNYRAAKAAVIHANKCMAIDLARYGIRVNCIAPAHIPTDINAMFDQSAIIREMQPLQRQGTPADVAEAMLFLASDRAAQITGIVLPVDGGTTAGPPAKSARRLLADAAAGDGPET